MKLINRIKSRLLHYSWDLAYGSYNEFIIKKGLTDVSLKIIKNHYKNKWFADPFIYKDDNNSLELFVEEFDYTINRGRIGHLVISKQNNKIEKLSIILERDTHLSFPAIYRVGNDVYVHPENSASGSSILYRYDADIDKLVDPKVLIEEPLTDAIIIKGDAHYYMYATKQPTPNGKELYIYHSDSFLGPYEFGEKKVFDNEIARMAGAFIINNSGEVIRPAQDCIGGDYGQAVLLMLGEKVVKSLKPPMSKYGGLHTFNTGDNTFVVDLKHYDLPWLYCLNKYLKR